METKKTTECKINMLFIGSALERLRPHLPKRHVANLMRMGSQHTVALVEEELTNTLNTLKLC